MMQHNNTANTHRSVCALAIVFTSTKWGGGCPLIRVCSLIRSNTVSREGAGCRNCLVPLVRRIMRTSVTLSDGVCRVVCRVAFSDLLSAVPSVNTFRPSHGLSPIVTLSTSSPVIRDARHPVCRRCHSCPSPLTSPLLSLMSPRPSSLMSPYPSPCPSPMSACRYRCHPGLSSRHHRCRPGCHPVVTSVTPSVRRSQHGAEAARVPTRPSADRHRVGRRRRRVRRHRRHHVQCPPQQPFPRPRQRGKIPPAPPPRQR